MTGQKPRKRTANKPATIYGAARRARVSVFTVSAVVNKNSQVSTALRRRVEVAVRTLSYRPNLLARSLAKRQTHTIGVIVPDVANPFFPLVLRGVENTAQKTGYSMLLCNSDNQCEKEESYLELLLSKRVDGILITKAPGHLSPVLLSMLTEAQVPVVLVMRTSRVLRADSVVTDDLRGAFDAVSHLIRLGYRRVALVNGPLNVSSGRARWQGYRMAIKEHGLAYDQALVAEGDYRVESGYRAGHILLPRRPEGVYVANYLMTVGFMKAAAEMGVRCPEDFGLVSFDDYSWVGCFRPRLTTVDLPKYALGVEAARLLLDRMKGRTGPVRTIKLVPHLVVRESCGFPLQLRDPASPHRCVGTANAAVVDPPDSCGRSPLFCHSLK